MDTDEGSQAGEQTPLVPQSEQEVDVLDGDEEAYEGHDLDKFFCG